MSFPNHSPTPTNRVQTFGELGNECAEAYHRYGTCMLEIAKYVVCFHLCILSLLIPDHFPNAGLRVL